MIGLGIFMKISKRILSSKANYTRIVRSALVNFRQGRKRYLNRLKKVECFRKISEI